jgi:hypothetical protein
MTKTEILNRVQEKFFKELESKPTWGKEQLKQKYLEVKNQILLTALEEQKDESTTAKGD